MKVNAIHGVSQKFVLHFCEFHENFMAQKRDEAKDWNQKFSLIIQTFKLDFGSFRLPFSDYYLQI